MSAPLSLNTNDLVVAPGDNLSGPVWAVLTTAGTAFSLSGWDALAQVRSVVGDPAVLAEFSLANGKIVTGSSTVISIVTGLPVLTSTLQLVLGSADTAVLPSMWFGVYDVRIYQAVPVPKRFTVVPTARFYLTATATV